MYTTEEFATRFRDLDMETLVDRLATQELTDEARAAIVQVLGERGTGGNQLELDVKQARRDQHLRTGADNRCDFCGKGLMLSGVVREGQKFCDLNCFHTSRMRLVAEDLDIRDIEDEARRLKRGPCPGCGNHQRLPDIHASHWIASMLVVTRTNTETKFSCGPCANRTNLWAMLSCATIGWWSIYGLFATPFRVIFNLSEIVTRRSKTEPSPALVDFARLALADQVLKRQGGGRYGLGP
jgi:hypothetical protein